VLFSHRIDQNNVGDYWSTPFHYYSEYLPKGMTPEKIEIKKIKEKSYTNLSPLIIGGGGLIGEKKFDAILRNIADYHQSHLKILWGVGDNVSKKGESTDFLDYIYKYDIVGIRDYIKGHENIWVPCSSCKSTLFDKYKSVKPKNRIVYFQHLYKPFPQEIIKTKPGPLMTNNGYDLESVIQFLSTGEFVITNSYHGAYWAQLLGRKVISSSWSTKFLNMKHQVILANPNEWYSKMDLATSYDILEEYRDCNDKFFKKIVQAL